MIDCPSLEKVYDELRTAFGHEWGAVVYFVRREADGPVKIGTTADLPTRTVAFLNGSPTPPIYELAIPGGQALEHWFHRRHRERRQHGEWYEPAEPVLEDARRFAYLQWATGDVRHGTLAALRALDPMYADLERLWTAGTPISVAASVTSESQTRLYQQIAQMRKLGFDLRFRR